MRTGAKSRKLTAEQFEVLAFVRRRVNATGHFPRASEIRDHLGWRSCSSATNALLQLEKQGFLTINKLSEEGRVLAWGMPPPRTPSKRKR
jgi:DNA-binding MarR family transcriptional regulator